MFLYLLEPEFLDGTATVEAFGSGDGKIWLDDVKCAGYENYLLSCPQTSFIGSHNCRHSEDSGVRCSSERGREREGGGGRGRERERGGGREGEGGEGGGEGREGWERGRMRKGGRGQNDFISYFCTCMSVL